MPSDGLYFNQMIGFENKTCSQFHKRASAAVHRDAQVRDWLRNVMLSLIAKKLHHNFLLHSSVNFIQMVLGP